MKKILLLVSTVLAGLCAFSQQAGSNADFIRENYTKLERLIPMRDGVQLFTAIYIPKDTSGSYPFLISRTPYSCWPYGEKNYSRRLGPSKLFAKEKYIFVTQDVRGRYMSEGQFKEMTPAIDNKKTAVEVDESSDTYDTIDWLLQNITHNNGKAGLYGISYPGFYATAALPGAHPALVAVSPQAPVTDEFEGDDAHHRGAFFLMDNFSFLNFFDHPRPKPWQQYPAVNNELEIKDVYDFYLKAGPIKNLNNRYFHDSSVIWNQYLQHSTKDSYWVARNIRPHLTNIKPATLVVGGLFDAEDMFGALKTYEALEQQNTGNDNRLVMGPWTHGAWSRDNWSNYAGISFGSNTAAYYQELEFNFFTHYLKGDNRYTSDEATIFFTGSNEWKTFGQWPPKETIPQKWILGNDHALLLSAKNSKGFDSYVSDPANPVPYIGKKSSDRLDEYLAADQHFASQRKDVLFFTSATLDKDLTLAGPVKANLFVSTTGTDADFIVKLIDVQPDGNQTEQLVRAEVLRGKFRNSYQQPEPFVPGKITPITLELNSLAHRFAKGHKIMIQVQSSWFPLVDRNPQTFVNIPTADEKDFQPATIRLYHDAQHPSSVEVLLLK